MTSTRFVTFSRPYDANLMRRYPGSRKPNNSKIDDAEAASPVTLDIPTQGQAVLAFSQCERVGYSLDMTSFSIFGESCPIQLPVTTPYELNIIRVGVADTLRLSKGACLTTVIGTPKFSRYDRASSVG